MPWRVRAAFWWIAPPSPFRFPHAPEGGVEGPESDGRAGTGRGVSFTLMGGGDDPKKVSAKKITINLEDYA